MFVWLNCLYIKNSMNLMVKTGLPFSSILIKAVISRPDTPPLFQVAPALSINQLTQTGFYGYLNRHHRTQIPYRGGCRPASSIIRKR